jgi:hypothetical protein
VALERKRIAAGIALLMLHTRVAHCAVAFTVTSLYPRCIYKAHATSPSCCPSLSSLLKAGRSGGPGRARGGLELCKHGALELCEYGASESQIKGGL